MAENTKIEWADATVNHWAGCTKVSPACDNCYAQRMAWRLWKVEWGAGQPRRQFVSARDMLEALDRKAARIGKRLTAFHNSLSDMFDNEVPDGWRMDAFKIMANTPNLKHLVLTKRIGNVRPYTQRDGLAFDLIGDGRVWLGITVVNQEEADRDIHKLMAVPAAKRFLSIEPLLGAVDLGLCDCDNGSVAGPGGAGGVTCPKCSGTGGRTLDWVIVGGESGPGARPMHPDWVRGVRDQCAAAGVPFLFKQHGDWLHTSQQPMAPGRPFSAWQWDDGQPFTGKEGARGGMGLFKRVGKAAAGRLLDGRTWDGVPT